MRKLMLAAMAAVVVGGCGALFNSGPAHVTFSSSPDGAEVLVNGTPRGTTPMVLQMAKNEDYSVVFRKDGYRDVTNVISRRVSPTYVVLDVLGGLLPVIIDAATGSWYVLSTNAVHGSLSPAASGQLTPEELRQVLAGVPAARFINMSDFEG
jgi:hypothetical protein